MKFLHLNFMPRSVDVALLVMRVWFGASMLVLHGWGKLTNFSGTAEKFADPIGIGVKASVAGAIFGEAICAALLVLGLFTRIAALGAGFTMFVAFWIVHGRALSGPGSGEMAFLYLAAFVTLFISGAGKYSLDAKLGAKT